MAEMTELHDRAMTALARIRTAKASMNAVAFKAFMKKGGDESLCQIIEDAAFVLERSVSWAQELFKE